jgi:hypothetical protein
MLLFILGLFAGTLVTLVIMSMLTVSAKADEVTGIK